MLCVMYPQFYYIEVNVICLLLISWILVHYTTNYDKQTGNVMFIRVVYVTMFIMMLEIGQAYLDGRHGFHIFVLNNLLNVVYLPLTGFVSMFWFLYVFCDIVPRSEYVKWRPVFIFPTVVLTAVCVVSPWTHWIFYIDKATNFYRRGRLHIIQEVITYAYFTIASIMTLVSLLREKDKVRRSKRLTVLSFILLPLISGVTDMLLPGFEITWPAVTLSLLFVFFELQVAQISTDSLTGLNHRRRFDEYVESKLKPESAGSSRSYMFMIDVDLFKDINDTFGHLAGDAALVETAEILRSVFGPRNAFLARYGGDEFAAVCLCRDQEDARSLCVDMYEQFEKRNTRPGVQYRLMVSAGFSACTGDGEDAVLEMIKQADRELYAQKVVHHTQAHN